MNFAGSAANGAQMQLYNCNGTSTQRWTFDSGSGRIVSPQSGRCLDATGVGFADGTRL
ncbi:RICIN domain-containing protein [Streptosporangium sp. G11]|uniref:RICIN domain-containing protein n=1 Tax=Streptosporangium sp. G11 TaxID=3436926 RepID=UPI003EB9C768